MAGSGRRVFSPGEVLTASNTMNYLMDQTVMNFAGTAARGSAIGTAVAEGMVSYLADSNAIEVYDGSAWVSLASTNSYRYVQTVYFTSNGTFTKASYPWLRGMMVTMVGAGGGGGGAGTDNNNGGAGGGGGGLGRTFITNIAGLASSISVTIGSGGAGGTGDNNGGAGGNTSFGTLDPATGGTGGAHPRSGNSLGGNGGNGGSNQLSLSGNPGGNGNNAFSGKDDARGGGNGGASGLGSGGGRGAGTSAAQNNGSNGSNYGGGGGGAHRGTSSSNGGAGANGLVILELFA